MKSLTLITICLASLTLDSTSWALSLRSSECTSTMPTGQECPDVQDSVAYLFEDPDHCSKYYQCTNGCFYHMNCLYGKLFDSEHEFCNTASQVDCGDRDCDNQPCMTGTTTTTTTTTTPITTTPCGNLACSEDGYVQEILCSQCTCVCSGGVGEEICCQSGLIFDTESGKCVYPGEIDCTPPPTTDYPNTGPTEPHTTAAADRCQGMPCDQDGLYALGDCEQCFCQCASGNPFYMCCSEVTVFDPSVGACEVPSEVDTCPGAA